MFSQVDNLFVKVSAGIKIEAEIKREDLCHRIEKRTDFAVCELQAKTFSCKDVTNHTKYRYIFEMRYCIDQSDFGDIKQKSVRIFRFQKLFHSIKRSSGRSHRTILLVRWIECPGLDCCYPSYLLKLTDQTISKRAPQLRRDVAVIGPNHYI